MISVGIDVSKGKSTVCIMKPGGEVLKTPFEMLHSIESILHLSNLLDQAMPNIQTILQDIAGNHKLTEFVKRYYHYGRILKMGKNKFISDYCKWSKKQGYRKSEHLADKIFAMAQNGIPVLPNSPTAKIVVLETVRMIHEIEASRNTILTQMQDFAKTLPEYSVIRDMHCIGDTLTPLEQEFNIDKSAVTPPNAVP